MAPLVIPDPSLVLLVGAAGSGKSTLVARLFAADEVVSSDALRAAVAGDEADQRASAMAFRILHATLDRRLRSGLLTVVDATNALAAHRRPLVARARLAGLPLVAIVLDLPPDVVHAQNAARSRVVDPAVIDRHLASIRETVDGALLALEGFDPIVVLHSPEAAATLAIERRRSPATPNGPG
jgi:protein phosphatase